MNYKVTNIPGDIKTKEELFAVIRRLTRGGYFFDIQNYYDGKGRSFYMVQVLGKRSEP